MTRKNIRKLSMHTIFFFKSFIKYFFLLILPILIVSIYSIQRFTQDNLNNIKSRNWNLMHQLKSEMDSLFTSAYAVNTYVSDAQSVYASLRQAFKADLMTPEAIESFQSIANYLCATLTLNKYYDSCYLYYSNEFGRHIATRQKYYYIQTYSQNLEENQLTQHLDYWNELGGEFGCRQMEIATHIPSRTCKVISIYQSIYSPLIADKNPINLVIQYDTDLISNYIQQLNLYPNQVILFIDTSGTVFYQSASGEYSDVWDLLPHNDIMENSYLECDIQLGNMEYMVSLIQTSQKGYYYLSLTPQKNLYAEFQSLIRVYFLIATVAFLISCCLAMLTTRNDYKKLQSIINIFDDAENSKYHNPSKNKKFDPYHLILENVINLFIKQKYLQVQIDNKQYQLQLAELRALQHQLNPHFLFNTLNTLYWETIRFTNAPNSCSAMIMDLSAIVEYSLNTPLNHVPLRDELEYLQHYVNIQTIRYANQFRVIYDVDEEALDSPCIKMILQPLVENALYHGIKENARPGLIKIKIYRRENYILIHVVDNGKGIPQDKLIKLRQKLANCDKSEDHIGLINTNRRLTLAYGNTVNMTLRSRYQFCTVISFRIPLFNSEEKS